MSGEVNPELAAAEPPAVGGGSSFDRARFSLRDLFTAIGALACVFGGFSVYGLFGAASVALLWGIVAVVYGRRQRRKWIRRLGVLAVLLSLGVQSMALAAWWLFDVGPIYSVASYPSQLTRMIEVADAPGADVKVAGLGSFLDTEYVWRLSLEPEQVERVREAYGLDSIAPTAVPNEFWLAFPHWWRPALHDEATFWSTPDFPVTRRGPDGEHFLAMVDDNNNLLYIWYKFNF